MLLSSLLEPTFIHLHSDMRSKDEVIEHLLRHFQKKTPSAFDTEKAERALADPEALRGAVFPSGMAVPHARLASFTDLLIGICVPRAPIPMEGTPVRLVVVVLGPMEFSDTYLNTVGAFTRIARDTALVDRLVGSRFPHEVLQRIEESGLTVQKRYTVGDAMTTEIATVSPDDKLSEVAKRMYSRNAIYLAVVDEQGKLVGEMRVLDFLEQGLPYYATMMEGLRFTDSLAPLEALRQKGETMKARDVMQKPAGALHPETSIAEAVFEFVRARRQVLPVVDQGRIVGTLWAFDILRHVIQE